MAKGHSKSNVYSNHYKTGTDQPSGWEYVAAQIKDANRHVKKLKMINEIYSGRGPGDLTNVSKAEQHMWAEFGGGKKSPDTRISDFQYNILVRKGIAREMLGGGIAVSNKQPSAIKKKKIK